jgi:hypothetical protein
MSGINESRKQKAMNVDDDELDEWSVIENLSALVY